MFFYFIKSISVTRSFTLLFFYDSNPFGPLFLMHIIINILILILPHNFNFVRPSHLHTNSGVIDTDESDSAIPMTPRSQTGFFATVFFLAHFFHDSNWFGPKVHVMYSRGLEVICLRFLMFNSNYAASSVACTLDKTISLSILFCHDHCCF